MPLLRHMLSALAVLLLTLVTGVGDAAHAMSRDGGGEHCAQHMMQGDTNMATAHRVADHPGMATETCTHVTDGGCCSAFCQVLVFLPGQPDAPAPTPVTLTLWQSDDLSALEEPESPERPPIL